MTEPIIRYGPKGILDCNCLFLFSKDGKTINKANNDEANITKGMLNKPNQNPITAINFASPKPIPSFFLTVR